MSGVKGRGRARAKGRESRRRGCLVAIKVVYDVRTGSEYGIFQTLLCLLEAGRDKK